MTMINKFALTYGCGFIRLALSPCTEWTIHFHNLKNGGAMNAKSKHLQAAAAQTVVINAENNLLTHCHLLPFTHKQAVKPQG